MAGKPFTHSPKSIHEPSPKPHGAARLIQPGHRGSLAATTCSLQSQLTSSTARASHLVHCTMVILDSVDNLRKHVHASRLIKNIELVVVSPLLRIDVPPLMAENMGNCNRPAISSLNCPPFIVVELCREDMGIHPCDRRRSISEYKSMFPAIDFSLIDTDHDVWWSPKTREKPEDVAARGLKFMKLLLTRKEKEIVVVFHGGFLIHIWR
ncbi:putative histidine phosphatase superfamily [Helianthus anomalus]